MDINVSISRLNSSQKASSGRSLTSLPKGFSSSSPIVAIPRLKWLLSVCSTSKCNRHNNLHDVGRSYSTGNRNPGERSKKLEGKQIDINEDHLGNEDIVTDWKRCGKYTFGVTNRVGQSNKGIHYQR